MNRDQCQELIHDLVDGQISQRDEFTLNTHLQECLDCYSVRQDLASIVSFCQTHRGEYQAAPQPESALGGRTKSESESKREGRRGEQKEPPLRWSPSRWLNHTWQL